MKRSILKCYTLFLIAVGAALPLQTQAGLVFSEATFDGIVDVRTSDTAMIEFLNIDFFSAIGETTNGFLDLLSDGMFFESEFSANGEGTASNGGAGESVNSGSIAQAQTDAFEGMVSSSAATSIEAEFELAGQGQVELDLGYSLFVDAFDNAVSALALASISAFTLDSLSSLDEVLSLENDDVLGIGSTLSVSDVFTLIIDVDDFGFGPYVDTLSVFTETAAIAVEAVVAPVSSPSTILLMIASVMALVSLRKRPAK